LAVEDRELKM